jgi:hypothetical protein
MHNQFFSVLILFSRFWTLNSTSHPKFELSQILSSIDINTSLCLNIILLSPSPSSFQAKSKEHELFSLRRNTIPIVLVELQEGINNSSLTWMNNLIPAEGCRIILDITQSYLLEKIPNLVKLFIYKVYIIDSHSELQFFEQSELPRITSSAFTSITYTAADATFIVKLPCDGARLQQSNLIPSPSTITKLCARLQNGQGKRAYFESDASINIRRLLEPKPHFEYQNYMEVSWKFPHCTYSEVVFRLVAYRVNVTFGPNSQLFSFSDDKYLSSIDSDPILIFNVEKPFISSEMYFEGQTSSILMNQDRVFIFYCSQDISYSDPSWLLLLESFDVETWVGICLTAVAFAIIYKNVSFGLDIVYILIGQTPLMQRQWHRIPLIILLFAMFILSNIYCG